CTSISTMSAPAAKPACIDWHGVTREHSMADMRKLDIGYGYNADGGKTFTFRGRGIGMMPTIAEVLSSFPDRRFLINVKSR
ncbi:hypothetical protein ACC733_38450, partial [Rhizobium johnstonii]